MKTFLVTGSYGFIGRHLKRALLAQGNRVLEHNSEDGDISVCDCVERYQDVDIHHVFHLASRTFVPGSWERPVDFYRTSIIGTQQILELCRKKCISLSYVSAYIYGLPKALPIREDCFPEPNNPYAHSKYLTEQLCEFYADNFKLKIGVARPFNIYGPGQSGEFLIPHIIRQAINEDTIQIKDLRPKRDYLYIDDLIEGLLLMANGSYDYEIINFGSGIEYSVDEIINIVQKSAGVSKKVQSDEITRKNEIPSVRADITKARRLLGWSPKYSMEQGISTIVESMKI